MIDVVPVTLPMPLSMVSDVALETFHDSVLDWPAVIDAGLAPNELMTTGSGCVVAGTPADAADVFPTASFAATEYV